MQTLDSKFSTACYARTLSHIFRQNSFALPYTSHDNAGINKDRAQVSGDQRKLAEERAERNADQRREDADVKKGALESQ